MKPVRSARFASLLFASLLLTVPAAPEPTRVDEGRGPRLLAPGVLSTERGEYHPTFDPTRSELYFMRRTPGRFDYTIHASRLESGVWSEPRVASFSGVHRDAAPFLDPSGRTLYFDSRRPAEGLEPESINLWRVTRRGEGWGSAELLRAASRNAPQPDAAGRDEFGPVVDGAGTLHFYSFREPSRPGARYATNADGSSAPERVRSLPDPSASTFVSYLYLSPDGRVALMDGVEADGRGTDVYYALREADGGWSEARPLDAVNSPSNDGGAWMTPAGDRIFFASDRPTGRADARASNLYEFPTDGLPVAAAASEGD